MAAKNASASPSLGFLSGCGTLLPSSFTSKLSQTMRKRRAAMDTKAPTTCRLEYLRFMKRNPRVHEMGTVAV